MSKMATKKSSPSSAGAKPPKLAPDSLILRPSEVLPANAAKAYISLKTLRALDLDAGAFVKLNVNGIDSEIVLILTPDECDPDVVKVSRPFRLAAGLTLGTRVKLSKCPRPETADRIEVNGTKEDVETVGKLRIVFKGLELGNACIVSVSAGLADLSLDEHVTTRKMYIVGNSTETVVSSETKPVHTLLSAIGGLDKEIKLLKPKLEVSLNRPELFSRFNVLPERGFLLHGPPGTGKTVLLEALVMELDAHVVRVNGAALFSKYLGESEEALRSLFDEACRFAPSFILLDDLDALAPRRDGDTMETEHRIVSTLSSFMDSIGPKSRVVVIAATNALGQVDPSLRRPGRFGLEVEIGVPDVVGRRAILDSILQSAPNKLTYGDISELSAKTHGYVGADLSALCREAVMKTIEEGLANQVSLGHMYIKRSHMDSAILSVRPSAMREIMLETPRVYWSDVGGQKLVIQKLREVVEWPLLHSESFKRLGITPPRGVLLYGPPGCSKTLLAKALATEAGLNFLSVKGPELFNKYVGESERAVRRVFSRARSAAPAIIFFDEIDALSLSRGSGEAGGDRVLTSLLTEMDGIEDLTGVIVLAATNRPDVIDSALVRPGRLDRLIYVAPPDVGARRQILLIQLSKMATADDVDLDVLAQRTEGCSGAEVVNVCREAGLLALNEDVEIPNVCKRHFEAALATLKRNITPEMLEYFETFNMES